MGGGNLDVVHRLDRGEQAFQRSWSSGALEFVDITRVSGAEKDEVGVAVERDDRRGADLAVVAIAGADLVKGSPSRGGAGNLTRGDQLTRFERGCPTGRGRTSAPGSFARRSAIGTSIVASSATAAAVSSAHGAAKASEPPTVPRRRVSL